MALEMTRSNDAWIKFCNYRDRIAKEDAGLPATSVPPTPEYIASITGALQALEDDIKGLKTRIAELNQKSSAQVEDEKARLRHIQSLTTAYENARDRPPQLPPPDSPLPALLALRSSIRQIDRTKEAIRLHERNFGDAKELYNLQASRLEQAQKTAASLDQRLAETTDQHSHLDPAAVTERCRTAHTTHTRALRSTVKAFNKFVAGHVAAMLLAEDLNGPPAGQGGKIDDATLADLLGNPDAPGSIMNRRQIVAAEFRDLTEQLLNAAAADDTHDDYVEPKKRNAAFHFLVRAKVAAVDPANDLRLRLASLSRF